MKYARFEQVVIGGATLAVLAMIASSTRDPSHGLTEIVGGLALLVVVVAAVGFGRKGGLAAAIGASVVYTLLSVPAMTAEGGLTTRTLLLLVIRVLSYGLIGIVGGETCGQLRHSLTRYANAEMFDEWGHVFNQRYASAVLDKSLAGFHRYDQPFTVVLITLASSITADLSSQRVRTLVRGVADYLRGDLRMVDELARLDDGRFFVLLPNTPSDGGSAVATRVVENVRQLLGARDESVASHTLCPGEDEPALVALADELRPIDDDGPDDQLSGVYKSDGASERKPASERASSAPGASTLKISTAASPDGSTKQ